MPKRPPRSRLYAWRITRIRAAPLGQLEAPDEAEAIREAIRRFGITDPEKPARLTAQRVKEIGQPWVSSSPCSALPSLVGSQLATAGVPISLSTLIALLAGFWFYLAWEKAQ